MRFDLSNGNSRNYSQPSRVERSTYSSAYHVPEAQQPIQEYSNEYHYSSDYSPETGSNVKVIFFFAFLLFAMGVGTGYFWGSQASDSVPLSISNADEDSLVEKPEMIGMTAAESKKIATELDLANDYFHFIFLPKENISDPATYVANMKAKVMEVGNPDLIDKYNATGEKDNREQKIIEFFSFIIEDVKARTK